PRPRAPPAPSPPHGRCRRSRRSPTPSCPRVPSPILSLKSGLRDPDLHLSFGLSNPEQQIARKELAQNRRRYSGFTDPSPEEDQMSTTTDRPIKQPDANHPISIEPNPARVTVTVAGQVV